MDLEVLSIVKCVLFSAVLSYAFVKFILTWLKEAIIEHSLRSELPTQKQ